MQNAPVHGNDDLLFCQMAKDHNRATVKPVP